MKKLILLLISSFILSCADDPLPKPKGYLRLEYPLAKYKKANIPLPFSFDKNIESESIDAIKTINKTLGIDINYPNLKGTIHITYNPIENNNLENLLKDAQNLTQKHTIKADAIAYNPYENKSLNVYGMLYDVSGNAASQSQFYVTDSINHFISGSLYFYAKPNYDSIFPAAEYLKKDIKRIMESIQWNH